MIDVLKPLIQQFMPFAQQQMGFSRPPKLFLRQDDQNAANPMGKTGFYDPQNESITVYTTGRHPKDIMRSLAHELMHHTQKCNGDFDNVQNMGEEGYAQNNSHMRTMEIQAYQASIVFRDWEDSCKGTIYYEHLQKGDKSSMSNKNWKNRELNGLLMERFGFDFKPMVENLQEGGCPDVSAHDHGPGASMMVVDDGGGEPDKGDEPDEEVSEQDRAVELVDELRDLVMKLLGQSDDSETEMEAEAAPIQMKESINREIQKELGVRKLVQAALVKADKKKKNTK